MKICLPTELPGGPTAALAGHFGSAATFTILDTDTAEVEIIQNEHEHEHEHHGKGGCRSAQAVAGRGIQAVICKSIGRNAMSSLGAKVYSASKGTVRELVAQLQAGTLTECTDECAGGHHAGGHGHHHH